MKKVLNKFFISSLIFLSCCALPNDFNADKQIAREVISKNELIRSFIKDDNGNLYVITRKKESENSIIKKISTDNSISIIYQTNDYIPVIVLIKNELYFSMESSNNIDIGIYKIDLNKPSESPILIVGGKLDKSVIDDNVNSKISSIIQSMDYDGQDNIYFLDTDKNKNYLTNLKKLNLITNQLVIVPLIGNKQFSDNPLSDLNDMNFMINKESKEIYITSDTSLPSSDNESSNTLFKIDKNGLIDRIKIIYKDPVFLYKIDEIGNLYITTRTVSNRSNLPKIVRVNKDGSFVEVANHSDHIRDLIIDSKNKIIYILDGENRIFKIPLKGKNLL